MTVLALSAIALLLYARGVVALWRRAGVGAGVSIAQACAFAAASIVLLLSLVSPLDAIAESLFAAHMVQHEILMLVVAPLFVLARPLATWTWALPGSARTHLPAVIAHPAVGVPWRALTSPSGAFFAHAVALWVWHIPRLFNLASGNEAIHALQHASFLVTALFFWWAILQPSSARMRDGVAVLYLFATMMHTGALGALLTLAPTPWYSAMPQSLSEWGLSALEDQQIGGLIMWVPAGAVYLAAGLYIMARWLRAAVGETESASALSSAPLVPKR